VTDFLVGEELYYFELVDNVMEEAMNDLFRAISKDCLSASLLNESFGCL
jgi:hypothetical protein